MSAPSVRRQALAAFVTRVRNELPGNIVDLRLFGSEARGEATPESDIDVLVVVRPESARVGLENRIVDMAFDVNLEFGVYISPRVITPGILNHPVWRETASLSTVARDSIPL